MKYGFLILILLVIFALQISAQSLLDNGKIPDDLSITLKQQGGWGGNYSEMTIMANGDISHQFRPVFPIPNTQIFNGKKPLKIAPPKVTEAKLKLLIYEFEKIQFFRFGKDFPVEDEKENWSLSDQQTEVISIRINGQTKEISNYLGDNLKRTKMLRDLAEKIRGVGIWYLWGGKIPKNFEVWYRTTNKDKIERDFKIKSNGKIVETLYSSRFYPEAGKELPIFIKSKTVGKFSKQQLIGLIDEFEKIGFSAFRYSPLDKYSGCSNESVPNEENRTQINVQINRTSQMYASLYKNCNPQPETDAAKFEYIAKEIEKLLKTVKNIKLN